MEEKILQLCLTGMKAYNKADGSIELGQAADVMADSLEEILRVISERNPEVADDVDKYFAAKEGE